MRFKLPIKIVNEINETYDKWKGSLDPANDYLAGQIKDEKEMVAHITEDIEKYFLHVSINISKLFTNNFGIVN